MTEPYSGVWLVNTRRILLLTICPSEYWEKEVIDLGNISGTLTYRLFAHNCMHAKSATRGVKRRHLTSVTIRMHLSHSHNGADCVCDIVCQRSILTTSAQGRV